MSEALLFVYGSLRPGVDGEMAAWLASAARHVGRATARGRLYRVDTYPGFVPDEEGCVVGDLFRMIDPEKVLAALDDYEECVAPFPEPREYRREMVRVESDAGPVTAWTYVYARDVGGLERIGSGDFLEGPDVR